MNRGATMTKFSADALGFLQLADTAVLAAVARGELDLNRLARETLAARGMDASGQWIGFDAARARVPSVHPETRQEATARLARRLGFPDLVERKSDRADFREVAVWHVREALEAAYDAGVAATTTDAKRI